MKTLYLVRHAKSSWKDSELRDIDRPLNKRGERDSPFMAKLMCKNKEIPDLMISSPAVRAFEIAKAFAKEFEISKKDIVVDEKLYMADIKDFHDVVFHTNNKINKLMLFSHNFGITTFANKVSDKEIDNIPTSGVVRVDFEIDNWKDFAEQKGKLIFFEYPKKHLDGDKTI